MPEHKMETIGGIRYRPEHTDRAKRSGQPVHNAVTEPEPAKTLGTGAAAKRGAKRGTGGADGD